MENPATWGPAEKIVYETLVQAEKDDEKGLFGLSRAKKICNALAAAGLLIEPITKVEGICETCGCTLKKNGSCPWCG